MRNCIYFLVLLLPVCIFAQPVTNRPSSSDYWHQVGIPGFSDGRVAGLSLAIHPVTGQPWVAYVDVVQGSTNEGPATVRRFDGSNWVTVGPRGFTIEHVGFTDLAFDTAGIPWLVYGSACSLPHRATAMKFINDTWTFVGNNGFSENDASYTSLTFSPAGQPYVAFLDLQYEHKATVMKYDGNSWVDVGPPRFTPEEAWKEEIAFSWGQPYVAFWNYPSTTASVMKFNGSGWESVGSPQITGRLTTFESLAVSPQDGWPYLAFSDSVHSGKVSVIRYTGSDWVPVGEPAFSDGFVSDLTMAFSPTGEPYVFYWDNFLINSVVKKFDGANWIPVGVLNFSGGYVSDTDLAFGLSGEPYVSYQDYNCGDDATVMKYDSPLGNGEKPGPSVSAYPNPFKSTLILDLSSASPGEKKIEIRDLQGKMVHSSHTNMDKTIINTDDLPSGAYILRVITPQGVLHSDLIKN